MNAAELQAFRRLLFYSAAEAARYLAADEERPQGVEERTWNRWESGKVPVPENIAATVRAAVAYRSQAIEAASAAIEQAKAQAGGEPPTQLVLLWYSERDDWPDAPLLWRPQQSALAAVLAEHGEDRCHLVPFDAIAFRRWRQEQGAEDSRVTRTTWAVEQTWE